MDVARDNQSGFEPHVCRLLEYETRDDNPILFGHTREKRLKLGHRVLLEAVHLVVCGCFPLLMLRQLEGVLVDVRDFDGLIFPLRESSVKRIVRDLHKRPRQVFHQHGKLLDMSSAGEVHLAG